MPSERPILSYRPDDAETEILRVLSRKLGLPKARVIGQALRQMAEKEGIKVKQMEDTTEPGAA